MSVPDYNKQLPAVIAATRPFWDAARRHELVVYRCAHCGACYLAAHECHVCARPEMAWTRASGRGQVYTFCIYRQAFHPAWKADIPYNVAYVKLDEGPVLMTNIVGCRNEDIYIGMPVEVTFEDITSEISLPKFEPAKKTDS